jgi:hypothetical protein
LEGEARQAGTVAPVGEAGLELEEAGEALEMRASLADEAGTVETASY